MVGSQLRSRVAAGLTDAQVREREARGLTNRVPGRSSRGVGAIVLANVCTVFNLLIGGLCLLMLLTGPWQDALFGIAVVANTGIGVVQELRAKRTLDRLTLLSRADVAVRRDGAPTTVPPEKLVVDDVVLLSSGCTVPVDGTILAADGLEIDESLLTGEADPVVGKAGERVLSGSFAVAGTGEVLATRVGAESYAAKLAAEAGRFALTGSELRRGIDRILKVVGWLLLPIGVLLIVSQSRLAQGWRSAVSGTVAGLVTMIPEGLVLLTSVAFAVGVVRLGRRRCLVQELPAIEGLARVDVVCVDKTGTLTEPAMRIAEVRPGTVDRAAAERVLAALARVEEKPNASTAALAAALPDPHWTAGGCVPFSSARRWSGADFGRHGAWALGAPDVLLSPGDPALADAGTLAARGLRVLAVCRLPGPPAAFDPPDPGTRAAALVVLEQALRPDARSTLDYFGAQGVAVKVVSGDDPATVGAVAGRLGLAGADRPVDSRTLPDDAGQLADTLADRSCFGRTAPHQKREFVHALQSREHVVAMTGDGVNDVLALKDADIGVSMGSGSPATRAVAQVVLLDDSFAALPAVVAEGRRVLANIERVSSLFVTKTCYAMLLAVLVGIAHLPFPFLPRHLTVVGTLTIGIPAFLLALAPNTRRAVPGFVGRVLRFAIPAGVLAAACSFTSYALARANHASDLAADRTTATLALFVVTLGALCFVARPLSGWRLAMVAAMAGAFALVLAVPFTRDFFALHPENPRNDVTGVVIGLLGIAALAGVLRLTRGRPAPATS